MGTEPIYCYKQDKKLIFSNEDFEKLLNNANYDVKAASCVPFPNDYLLAQFSKLAYSEHFETIPTGWELLTTARNKAYFNGYFGVAFWNPKFCHVAIAHRGTEVSNLGALLTDFKLSFNWNKTNQAESATTFVYEVGEIIKKKMRESGQRYQLSITGHSLGAWLAQMTTFTLKYFTLQDEKFVEDFSYTSNVHAHTVVFESPGCKGNMEELSKHFVPSFVKRKFGNFYSLDMTIYLSEINFINCVNKHVGTVYKIRSTSHSINDVLEQFNKLTGEIEREIVLDSKSGFLASLKAILKPITKIDFKTITSNANQHSLNVFDDNEDDFIRDWVYIRDFHPHSINNVKDPLPYFEVDYEYDLIKSNDVIKTIALIKNYKLSRMFVSNVLSANVIFKMRSDQFKDTLIKCCDDFYIKDKYGVKNFLLSEHQIMNILVKSDLPDGCRLESSILNNVCKFYSVKEPHLLYFKLDKYYLISWDALYNTLKTHSTLFENMDINLLIIECCNMSHEDVEAVNRFLTEVNCKVIILSDDTLLLKSNKYVAEGFSHNIIFQDLEENSQERLIEQKNIVLNNRRMSIKSFLKFNEETYIHLNSALPSHLLLHLLTVPDNETLIVDSYYRNILNGITIELFKEIDLNENNLASIANSLMFIENECPNSYKPITTLCNLFNVNIDFDRECLKHLTTQSNKVLYLFVEKDSKMFLSKIFRKDLYIKRDIANPRLVKSSILTDSNPDQLYYLCGNKDILEKLSVKLDSERYVCLTEEQAKLKLQDTKVIAHILKIEDKNTIRWLASRGNIQSLKRYLIIEEPVTEEDLVNENVVILSGEPGTGKSSTVKMLYLSLQSTHWIFALPLANANFENFTLNYYNIARFILNTCGIMGEYIQFLLSFSLRYPTSIPIYLMFDGFEQISNIEHRKIFVDIVNCLKYSSNVKILITTRTYACKELENGISVPASYYLQTNIESNIVNYLTKFWFSQMQVFEDQIDLSKLQGLAKSIMKTASNFFGESISTFLGIPLHIRIMAEIYAPSMTSIEYETGFSDFLLPYQKLIETHCNTYFKRNYFPDNKFLKDIVMNGVYQKMFKLAMTQLFRFDIEFSAENDIDELNQIGLVHPSTSYLNFSFIHDSVRDYFIANLIHTWLEGKLICCNWELDTFLMKFFLLKQQYKEIRLFLNCYLKNSNIHQKTLNICRGCLKQFYVQDESFLFNGQESFFHICLKENLNFLFQNFLIELLEDQDVSTALLCQRNRDLKTPLFLLIEKIINFDDAEQNIMVLYFLKKINELPTKCIKSILLSTFFTHFATADQLLGITKISTIYENVYKVLMDIKTSFLQIGNFLTACRRNKSKDIFKILHSYTDDTIKKYLVSVTNELKQTGLHVTISEKIILELLKFGININSQDHHGLTPLLRAIIGGKTEIALFLIKEGADLSIPDYFNNSALMHAAKYGNEEIVKVLIDSEQVDIKASNRFGTTALMLAARNGNKRIVSSLLERGVPVDLTDQTGLSALYHGIKTNQIHLVKLFVQYGADIDVQDIYGSTPLLDSIKKSNWNAVNTLLDNGADPFIENYNDEYCVKLLIQKEKPNILKKILTITFEVVACDDIESLKYLNEYDKSYIHQHVLKKNTSK